MTKHLAAILVLIATALPVTLCAAVPLRWTVETSRVQPAQWEGYHGETIEFAATMQSYGKPLAITNDLIGIYWQTNGMGSAYWTAPAVLSNHVMTARFTPSMDVGAPVYSCFIGAPGEIYRAAFQLRLRPSPGAVPAELPLPVKTLDFAQVQILHAPYYSKAETDAKIIELAPAPGNYATVSNRAMTAVQPSAISDMETKTRAAATYQPIGNYLTTESDPTVADWAKKPNPAPVTDLSPAISYTTAVSNKLESTKQPTISDLATIRSGAALGATALQSYTETDPTIKSWAKANTKPSYTWTEISSKPSWIGSSKPSYNWSEIGSKPTIPTDSTVAGWGYLKTESDPTVAAALAPVTNTVNAWQTYWDGDDVRVTVTNYYGSADLPRLYLEQKITDGGTNYFKTIWSETSRLDIITNRIAELEADVDTKADRAWGFYDSHSGSFAPDGFTSISSESILISKDMSYQKTVTLAGEVWVLTATDPTVITGTETNGFFRISDSEGNNVFEIVKGDKRTVPATCSAVTAGNNSLTITYNVVAAEHPAIEICDGLGEQHWIAEGEAGCPATVVWSGSSGAWIATVTGTQTMPKMFVKGTYEVGGETYARHGVPLGFEKVVIGGVYYRVDVETVNGKKLMVLTEL